MEINRQFLELPNLGPQLKVTKKIFTYFMLKKKYPKLFNPTDINTDQTKVIYSATSLVKQKEPQILIQTVLKNRLCT